MNTPDPETERPIIGIDLDDIEAFAVWGEDAVNRGHEDDRAGRLSTWDTASLPPAVLLPRFSGEPLDVDLCWPPHPRGLGDVYPPESRVEDASPPGRLPVAYAWAMLAAGEDRVWKWRIGEHETFASAQETVIRIVAEIVRRLAGASDAALAAVVVPVHLPELSLHRLEEAARRSSLHARFIPRDVAAASLALEMPGIVGDNSFTPTASDPPWVLTMHLGLTAWEVGAIDLGGPTGSPEVRGANPRRRSGLNPLSGYGLWIFEHMARRAIEMSYRNCPTHRVWELLWCTPWMRTVIECAGGGPEGPWPQPLDVLSPHVCRREFIRQQVRQVIPRIVSSEGEAPALYSEYLTKPPKSAEFRDWTIATKRAFSGPPPIASIVTGPLASLPHDDVPIGCRQCKDLLPLGPEPRVTGLDLPRDGLARGAARFAARTVKTLSRR